MYALAYAIDGDDIDIIMCKNDDELVGAIYDLIQSEEYYDIDTVDDMLSTLENLMVNDYFDGELSITIAKSSGEIIFQM